MAKRRLVISRSAYLDIDRIVEFNNTRNQSDTYSKKIIKGLFSYFNVLIVNPNIGIKTNDPKVLLLVWDLFYILYEVSNNLIIILSIYHQKENLKR
ncbi:MAG: type II toxin-antitoxin system RelE/ParE family toxin [Pyrinomonadaceae bacterium]|nr:type II toxin-antitoxin system RelE/ParE family toxin [Sphingobacteriaceae bacterium]